MGTNFYVKTAEHGPDDEGLHIGKRSTGWDFLFRAHPELGLVDCEAWLTLLHRPDVQIVAEYGVPYTAAEFWPMATRRPAEVGGPNFMRSHEDLWRNDRSNLAKTWANKQWTDSHGHPFADYEFC